MKMIIIIKHSETIIIRITCCVNQIYQKFRAGYPDFKDVKDAVQ